MSGRMNQPHIACGENTLGGPILQSQCQPNERDLAAPSGARPIPKPMVLFVGKRDKSSFEN
jgi:hypothetical protein